MAAIKVYFEHPKTIGSKQQKLLACLIAMAYKLPESVRDPVPGLFEASSLIVTAQALWSELHQADKSWSLSELKDSMRHLFDITLLCVESGKKRYVKLVTQMVVKDIDCYCVTFYEQLAQLALASTEPKED